MHCCQKLNNSVQHLLQAESYTLEGTENGKMHCPMAVNDKPEMTDADVTQCRKG